VCSTSSSNATTPAPSCAATYENVFEAGYPQRKLDGSAGFRLEGGKTNVQLTASYSNSGRLLAGERDFAKRALALQLKNNPDFGTLAVLSAARTYDQYRR